jgi:predicted RNase H-like HicB family nuclease
MNSRYAVVLEPGEKDWIVASVPSLPGCHSQGRTREEALNNIQEAIQGYVAVLAEDGEPIPKPDLDIVMVEVAA